MQLLCILSSILNEYNRNYCVGIKVRVLVTIIEYFYFCSQNHTLSVHY